MANYNKSIETKNQIINACRELFYEQSLTKTTYADIAKKANVLPGTIAYHFHNTYTLAAMISTQEIADLESRVLELTGGDRSSMLANIVAHLIHLNIVFEDAKYRCFYMEFGMTQGQKQNYSSYLSVNSGAYIDFYREKFLERNPSEDTIAADFYMTAFSGLDGPILYFINENIERLTPEHALRYSLSIYFSIFHYEWQELDSLIDTAIEIVKKLNIRNDGLHINIEWKEND